MIIQSCAYAIHYPKNPRIREHLFDLEKHFTGFQTPFTLVPLPPDAPMEIPRIVAGSLHGHSQLTICGNNAQVLTNYDAGYERDVGRCIQYMRDKCNQVVSSLSILGGGELDASRFYYSGLSMNLLLDEEDGITDSVDYLSSKFINYSTNLPTDEVQFRLALVVANKFYVNVVLQNSRAFAGIPDERGSFAGLKNVKNRLQVVLDINDRYAFNHEKNYCSCNETVSDLASLTEQFVSKHIDSFIKNGEINYAG